ncbi:hypothetical protein HA466_0012190 [Hirschfeldia incana]|nr:hypothetical protein HA466_0012190 [Hirschfeldia incana]
MNSREMKTGESGFSVRTVILLKLVSTEMKTSDPAGCRLLRRARRRSSHKNPWPRKAQFLVAGPKTKPSRSRQIVSIS